MSPTARTLAYLREQGHYAEVTEHWNHFSKRRIDLFGCVDILCIQGSALLAIQTTSAINHTTRRNKAMESKGLLEYLKTGNLFEVWSWGQPDGPRTPWKLRVTQLTLNKAKTKIVEA